jgi:hypothetical protein
MKRRIQSKPHSFEQRLTDEALRLRALGLNLPPGLQRDEILRKARQVDIAAHLNDWLRSPGLQSPK